MNQLTSGKRPVWSKDNDDAVQLFRDIYFEKYPTGTRATVVYNDPKRSYGKYNKDGFARHFKSTLEKVSTFKTFGTGLSESFRHRCRLNVRPEPEDRASKITEKKHGEDNKESDDEDDESYDDSGEEDVTLVSELDDESFVESIKNKTKKSTVPIAKKAVTTPVATSMPREAVTNEVPLLSPQLVNCQGGVLAGYVPLFTGVEYEFSIADNRKQLMQRMYLPETFQRATSLFYRHGLTEYNVYIAGVQENIDKMKKKTKLSEVNKIFHEEVLFDLPYEIEPSFYDEKGNEVNKIFEGKGPRGLLWAFFYLKKKNEDEKTPKKTVGFDRENKRETDENGFAYRNVASNNRSRYGNFHPNEYLDGGFDYGRLRGTFHPAPQQVGAPVAPQHQQQQQQASEAIAALERQRQAAAIAQQTSQAAAFNQANQASQGLQADSQAAQQAASNGRQGQQQQQHHAAAALLQGNVGGPQQHNTSAFATIQQQDVAMFEKFKQMEAQVLFEQQQQQQLREQAALRSAEQERREQLFQLRLASLLDENKKTKEDLRRSSQEAQAFKEKLALESSKSGGVKDLFASNHGRLREMEEQLEEFIRRNIKTCKTPQDRQGLEATVREAQGEIDAEKIRIQQQEIMFQAQQDQREKEQREMEQKEIENQYLLMQANQGAVDSSAFNNVPRFVVANGISQFQYGGVHANGGWSGGNTNGMSSFQQQQATAKAAVVSDNGSMKGKARKSAYNVADDLSMGSLTM
jgi:hypothetical protein